MCTNVLNKYSPVKCYFSIIDTLLDLAKNSNDMPSQHINIMNAFVISIILNQDDHDVYQGYVKFEELKIKNNYNYTQLNFMTKEYLLNNYINFEIIDALYSRIKKILIVIKYYYDCYGNILTEEQFKIMFKNISQLELK